MRALTLLRGKSVDFLVDSTHGDRRGNRSHVVAFNENSTGWICETGWERDVQAYLKSTQGVRYELPVEQFEEKMMLHVIGQVWTMGWPLVAAASVVLAGIVATLVAMLT